MPRRDSPHGGCDCHRHLTRRSDACGCGVARGGASYAKAVRPHRPQRPVFGRTIETDRRRYAWRLPRRLGVPQYFILHTFCWGRCSWELPSPWPSRLLRGGFDLSDEQTVVILFGLLLLSLSLLQAFALPTMLAPLFGGRHGQELGSPTNSLAAPFWQCRGRAGYSSVRADRRDI